MCKRIHSYSALMILLPFLLSLTACDELIENPPELPSVEYQDTELTSPPKASKLASYFCKDMLGSTIYTYVCKDVFGTAPKKKNMKFNFLMTFNLENPNAFPIPLVEMLLALDVFQGKNNSELSAICVSFCDPDAGVEECDPADAACEADEGDIKSIEDFNPTTEDLIGLATDIGEAVLDGELPEDLQFKVIPAASKEEPGVTEARINFQLNIDTMLKILKVVAKESIGAIEDGKAPDFSIPYAVNGTLFFDIPRLGRVAIDFGPFDGVWDI